jgi:hypothetical protein
MDRFGDKIIWAKQLMTKLGKFTQHTFAKAGPYIDSGLQLAKNMFRYVRSGQLFDKLGIFIKVAKGYLAEIPKLLHNIWSLFRTGAAKVSLTRGGKAAGRLAARAYGRATRGFKDAGASLGGSGLDSWSGVMDDVGGFAGEAMDPFSGPYGSGEAGKAEHYEARKRAVMNKRRMRQEEAEWRKAGKNVRWQKLRRTMGRIGKVTEPVAGHIGNAGFYGGLGGKIMAGTAILAGGMGLMSAFDVGMSDNLSEPDDEKNKAGYRKYGDKIEANQKDLDTTNEALEYTRETHDQVLIAALEAERAAKIAEKDLLDKKSKHLNDTEAAYERKRKVIETLQSYQKRLKKMGKDKEADAMEKRLDELKKDAGKDKGELASYGVSTKTENQKWQKVNDWAVKAEMMVSSFFSIVTNWKFLGGMGAKIVSLGSSLVKYVAPALTKMTGWILKLVGFAKAGSAFSWIGGMIEKVADIGGKVATKISPLLKFVKGLGVFEKLGAVVSKLATLGQWIGRFLGILDGVMIAAQTEGSWGRRLFAGTVGGVASLGTRAASDFGGAALEATGAGAVAGGALQIAGNTAAPWIGHEVADIATRNLWDRFMTTDSQIPTVMPSSVVDVGTGGSVSASGTGTKVDASGATTLTLKINNMKEITESANSRIVANNSGLSGGR